MNKTASILALLLTLAVAACGKKSEEAAPGTADAPATKPAISAVAATSATEPAWETVAEQTEREDLEVNEPMPPVDESSAPPTVRARAQLQVLKAGVNVTGDITLYQDAYGTGLLRIENLQSPEGLAVDLVFTRAIEPRTAAEVAGPVVIGSLKGATGNMNYTIGADTSLSDQRSLVLMLRGSKELLAYCPLTSP